MFFIGYIRLVKKISRIYFAFFFCLFIAGHINILFYFAFYTVLLFCFVYDSNS